MLLKDIVLKAENILAKTKQNVIKGGTDSDILIEDTNMI